MFAHEKAIRTLHLKRQFVICVKKAIYDLHLKGNL